MLSAREGEEIVCPRGTVCGRITRDANNHIADVVFDMLKDHVSSDGQRHLCTCCDLAVAVHEHFRWRVHLRRGWVR